MEMVVQLTKNSSRQSSASDYGRLCPPNTDIVSYDKKVDFGGPLWVCCCVLFLSQAKVKDIT